MIPKQYASPDMRQPPNSARNTHSFLMAPKSARHQNSFMNGPKSSRSPNSFINQSISPRQLNSSRSTIKQNEMKFTDRGYSQKSLEQQSIII